MRYILTTPFPNNQKISHNVVLGAITRNKNFKALRAKKNGWKFVKNVVTLSVKWMKTFPTGLEVLALKNFSKKPLLALFLELPFSEHRPIIDVADDFDTMVNWEELTCFWVLSSHSQIHSFDVLNFSKSSIAFLLEGSRSAFRAILSLILTLTIIPALWLPLLTAFDSTRIASAHKVGAMTSLAWGFVVLFHVYTWWHYLRFQQVMFLWYRLPDMLSLTYALDHHLMIHTNPGFRKLLSQKLSK